MAEKSRKKVTGKKAATKKSAKKSASVKKSTKKSAADHVARRKKGSVKRGSRVTAGTRKAGARKPEAGSASKRIDQAIADLKDWRGEKLAEIRRLIREVDPGVTEDWKWMGTPVWSHEGMYALANAHKGKVKLTFHHGARLRDPKKLFNAGLAGNQWRAIDFFEGDRIDETGLKDLLREAIDYNSTHAVPKSRGSKA